MSQKQDAQKPVLSPMGPPIWSIARREFVAFFNTNVAYIVIGMFLLLVNFFFFF